MLAKESCRKREPRNSSIVLMLLAADIRIRARSIFCPWIPCAQIPREYKVLRHRSARMCAHLRNSPVDNPRRVEESRMTRLCRTDRWDDDNAAHDEKLAKCARPLSPIHTARDCRITVGLTCRRVLFDEQSESNEPTPIDRRIESRLAINVNTRDNATIRYDCDDDTLHHSVNWALRVLARVR